MKVANNEQVQLIEQGKMKVKLCGQANDWTNLDLNDVAVSVVWPSGLSFIRFWIILTYRF